MRQHLADIITKAQGQTVLCVGDVMLDRFVYGTVDRISPESPVPVLRKVSTVEMPGGAGNVARNMAAMGLQVIVAGCIGNDAEGEALEASLNAHERIETRLAKVSSLETVVKTRFVASNQQLLRVDSEESSPALGISEAVLISAIEKAAKACSAVVVSDYAKGAITPATFHACLEASRKNRIPLLVDRRTFPFTRVLISSNRTRQNWRKPQDCPRRQTTRLKWPSERLPPRCPEQTSL